MLLDNDGLLSCMSSSKKNDNSSRFHSKDKKLFIESYGRKLSVALLASLAADRGRLPELHGLIRRGYAYIFPIVAELLIYNPNK